LSYDNLIAFAVFAFVSSVTPGPNNLMLLASGANFGFARTRPAIAGVAVGFSILLLAVGLGLGAVLTAFPIAHSALKIAGCLYILFLSWKIAAARKIDNTNESGAKPPSFLQATALQWVNPKAWVMAVTAAAVYTSVEAPFQSIIAITVLFFVIMIPPITLWAGFGVALRGFLDDPVRLKWFNIAMGLALAATIWPILMP